MKWLARRSRHHLVAKTKKKPQMDTKLNSTLRSPSSHPSPRLLRE